MVPEGVRGEKSRGILLEAKRGLLEAIIN